MKNTTKKEAQLFVRKTNIILASRIIRLKAIPKPLREYGISQNLGVEKIAEILDDLDKKHLLTIKIDPVACDDGMMDCIISFYVINPKTKKETRLSKLGSINLSKIFGNNGLQ